MPSLPAAAAALQELPPGPYLARLKELTYGELAFKFYRSSRPAARSSTWELPPSLAQATSLELLDLSINPWVRLRGAEDAALLRRLPRLRRVVLPVTRQRCPEGERDAAAVDAIRQGLREGAGAGPSHGVEVVASVLWM